MIDGIFKLYREDITMKTIFEFDPWRLIETELHKDDMRLSESMTSIGNGHMGMRGNFEERYSGDSHRGTYLAGVWFPDKTRVGWWKNGYPQYFGKVINAMNIISLRVRIDREDVDLYEDDVVSFSRVLDMRAGVLTREFVIRREKGTVRVSFERFVSVATAGAAGAALPRDGGLRLQGRADPRHRRGRAQRGFQLRRNLLALRGRGRG